MLSKIAKDQSKMAKDQSKMAEDQSKMAERLETSEAMLKKILELSDQGFGRTVSLLIHPPYIMNDCIF